MLVVQLSNVLASEPGPRSVSQSARYCSPDVKIVVHLCRRIEDVAAASSIRSAQAWRFNDGVMVQLFFAQKAFIIRDQRLLLVRKSDEDPDHPGLWEVPGGRMEFGEDVDEHIKREVREEVGLDVVPGDPFYIWQWRVSRPGLDQSVTEWQIVAVARLCRAVSEHLSDAGRVAEDYLAEMEWVPFDALLTYDVIPNMRPVMNSFLKAVAGHTGHS